MSSVFMHFIRNITYRIMLQIQVKVKLSSCLIKYHIMKTYGAMEIQLHAFLTSALYGGEQSVSHLGHFISSKTAPLSQRLGRPQSQSICCRYERSPCTCLQYCSLHHFMEKTKLKLTCYVTYTNKSYNIRQGKFWN